MKNFFRPSLFFVALLCLMFCGRVQAVVSTPYSFAINQSAQESGQIVIDATTGFYDGYYYVDIYNASGESLGTANGVAWGSEQNGVSRQQNISISLPCPSAQTSRNWARGVLRADGFQANGVQVNKTSDSNPTNLGTTNPASAPFIGSNATVWTGGLDSAAPPNEAWVYWRVHLGKKQHLKVEGRAEPADSRIGSLTEIEILRIGDETGTQLANPLDANPFSGEFVNEGATGDFYLRARCTVWKICKLEMKVTVSGTCAPPPCVCATDSNTGSPLTPPVAQAPGPSGASPVQLSTGHEQSDFPADLAVYNPLGPGVEWRRQWREAMSLMRVNAPGFSPGWTHSYNQFLTARINGGLQLNYSNGAAQELTAVRDANGVLQSELAVPANATYFARGVPAAAGSNPDATTFFWQSVDVVWQDGTTWRFTPGERWTYRLTRITNATGQNLILEYDKPGSGSALDVYWQQLKATNYASWLQLARNAYGEDPARQYRLKAIKNDAGTALLTLEYRTPDGLLTSATDAYGRRVYYTWSTPAGMPTASLASVSQVFQVGVDTSALLYDEYSYVAFGNRPLLSSVKRVHPNGTGAGGATTATVSNTYDAQARVASTRDANGNRRTYTYGTNQVGIAVYNAAGTLVAQWTRFIDDEAHDKGWADASGHRWELFYDDANNPRLPTRERDPEGRETVSTYDTYGNITSVTTPRGVKLTYTWNYSAWRLGRLAAVRKTAGTLTMPATTFTYFEPSGLLQSATAPHPNGSGTITTQYAYDSYGNITGVSEPGDASTPTRTTQFFYTQDGTYTQPMAVGKPIAVRDNIGNVTHLRYTANYMPYSVTDALGNATTNVYDYNDNPIRTILPATGQTGTGQGEIRYAYAYRGGPLVRTQIYNEAGQVARTFLTTYGAEGEVLSQSGDQLPQSTEYDALYRPVAFLDGKGQRTSYLYDANGRLTATYYPQANTQSGWDSVRTTSFTLSGQPLQTVDGRGVATNYLYNDADGQLTDIQYPASAWENQHFDYDALGRLSQQSNYSGSESYAYTAAETLSGRTTIYKKTDYSNMAPFVVQYAYNADGSRRQTATSAGTLSYAYDTAGRLSSVSEPNGRATQWSYFANDWLQSQKLPVTSGGGAQHLRLQRAGTTAESGQRAPERRRHKRRRTFAVDERALQRERPDDERDGDKRPRLQLGRQHRLQLHPQWPVELRVQRPRRKLQPQLRL